MAYAVAYAFLRILVQTRAKGHSAIGVVCYRFGLAAQSAFLGEDGVPRTFDYTHRTAIAQTGCALPHGASDAWRDPLEWAHRVEAADRRKNSRQCRDDVLGIPIALVEAGTHVAAIQEYAELLAAEHDTPVHFVIHPPDRGGKNWHAHVIYAGRRIDPEDGERFAAKRDRTQDVADRKDKDGNVIEKRGLHHRHRALWTGVCRGHGLALDWTPNEVPQIHIGPQACALERREIVKEASERMAEAIAGTGEAPPDRQTLRECAELAHGINDGLTVREMLDLDRDPVHPRAIMSPKTPPPAGQRIGQTPAPPQVAPALRLAPPPGIEHMPGIRLGPPPPPQVAPALRLAPPPGIEHVPGIRLGPPPPPQVAPALRLAPPPGIEHVPGIRLGPPPPQVAPALRLAPPPGIEHVPGIRLGPPPPPLRLSVRLPQPIHLRPEVREIPQRIREVVRTKLESAGAKRIESQMGSAAGSAGFHWADFGMKYGEGTARAANRVLDEEVSAFVPRGENRQTMLAHWEDWRRKLERAVKRWKAHVRRRHDKIVERITEAVLPTARTEVIDRIRQREAQLRNALRKPIQPKPAPAPARRSQRPLQVAPQRSPPTSGRWDPWG